MKKNNKQRGGAGRNQGRKLKYGEPTTPVNTRVPISKVKEFREYANAKLAEWKVKK